MAESGDGIAPRYRIHASGAGIAAQILVVGRNVLVEFVPATADRAGAAHLRAGFVTRNGMTGDAHRVAAAAFAARQAAFRRQRTRTSAETVEHAAIAGAAF